jgi:hypothetical protein
MLSRQIRHWVVALGLVTVAGVTAASAAGSVNGLRQSLQMGASAPLVSGDLGEIVVVAPHDLGEIIVRAPHDLDDVLVEVRSLPPSGQYLATVVVTASRIGGFAGDDGAVTALASVQ